MKPRSTRYLLFTAIGLAASVVIVVSAWHVIYSSRHHDVRSHGAVLALTLEALGEISSDEWKVYDDQHHTNAGKGGNAHVASHARFVASSRAT